MKILKFIRAYYWILGLTLIIYFVRTYFGDWLIAQTYLKQHGTLNDRPGICVPFPPFMVDIFVLALTGIGYLWTKDIKRRFLLKPQLTSMNYLEFAILTIAFIIPFIFFDIKLLELIVRLINDYSSAQPIKK